MTPANSGTPANSLKLGVILGLRVGAYRDMERPLPRL